MEVEDEKHVYGNYFTGRNKNNLYPTTTRASRRNASRRLNRPCGNSSCLPGEDSWG
jgi:hypothetical protein